MSAKLPNYLRTYRRRAGLTQKEIAFLLGHNSHWEISRYEKSRTKPSLRVLLSYQAILGKSSEELYAGYLQQIRKEVAKRAATILEKFKDREPDKATILKLENLNRIANQSIIN